MKIAYIANVRIPTEKAHGVQIMKTCEALVRLGHVVELIVPNRKTHISKDAHSYFDIEARFPIRRLSVLDTVVFGRFGFLLQSFTFACSLRFFLRKNTYDVLYSRDEHILALLSESSLERSVWESHTGAWNGAARRVVRGAKHLVVISQGLKEFYTSKGIPVEKITVAHDGIDLKEFSHPQSRVESRARLGLPVDRKIAMYIGRLDGWKGADILLDAAAHLPEHFDVVIIGGEEAQVTKLAARYPNVRFLGFHPYSELADNMAAADVLVLPNTGKDLISVKFTSPLKLFAYMTSNVPIVASDLPSIREILDERGTTFVPPDNPVALAEGIVSAQREGNQHAKYAKSAVTQYSWDERARIIDTSFKLFERK